MAKREWLYVLTAAWLTSAAIGCSTGAPAPANPPAANPAESDSIETGGDEQVAPSTSGSAPADDLPLGQDEGGPLRFEPTAKEKARQAADPSLAPSGSSGSLTDAVPEPLKKGAVGSLGNALFRGVLQSPTGGDANSPKQPEN